MVSSFFFNCLKIVISVTVWLDKIRFFKGSCKCNFMSIMSASQNALEVYKRHFIKDKGLR